MKYICKTCLKTKPKNGFSVNKQMRSGLASDCKSCVTLRAKLWYENNKDRKRAYDTKRRAEKTHLYRAASKRWREAHPEKKRADTGSRRRRVRSQMPPWISPTSMACFYESAQRVSVCLGVPHDVDHIMPIHGKGVSGLHVPWNLQVMPSRLNARKSASY